MKKSTILWCLVVVAVACLSSVLTGVFYRKSAPSTTTQHQMALIDLKEASLPEGAEEIEQDAILDAQALPSQLTKISLPDVQSVARPLEGESDVIAGKTGSSNEIVRRAEEKPAPIDLRDGRHTVVPLDDADRILAEESEDESGRVMIQAPVRYKLINTLDEYKNFKRTARGSYPEVNFSANRLLVLESDSDLPDNLFEIVDVTRTEDDKVLVTYRVNIIGLNERTNTHSVKVLKKSNREIQLKQVL